MVIVAIESHEGAVHMQITTIGFDLAKNVLQVHGIDAAEKVVRSSAALPHWHGGLCHRTLLGT
jgi:hypothetical protein